MKVRALRGALALPTDGGLPALVQAQRGDHCELGYIDHKSSTIHYPLHVVNADHFSDPGFEVTPRYVLVRLARFKNRLLSDYALALHFARQESRVVDVPVPALQLNREIAPVLDRNPVGKNKMILPRTRIRRLVFRLHCNLYTLGNFRHHLVKNINFFYFKRVNLPLFT
jgi:hypothetical protein